MIGWAAEKKKKRKGEDEITQTLEIPKDPPAAVVAETRRLSFHVSPLTPKGLLSRQVRDSLKNLSRQASGGQIVKLRAFVAGTGDLRRVQTIVSEYFTDRKQPLPALAVVQAGGLPMEGAQVVMEATAQARRAVNPNGLAFISGQVASIDRPLQPIAPLVSKALGNLNIAIRATRAEAADVLRVSCFMTSLDDVSNTRVQVMQAFPKAAVNIVQTQREPLRTIAECEAVVRLRAPAGDPLRVFNPEGLPASTGYSHVAVVGAERVVLTGTQLAFRSQDADVRLAFQRLQKAVEGLNGSLRAVAIAHIYPLSNAMFDKIRQLRFEFFDKSRPPASTMLVFEGLPSLDASFAIDVVAVL